MALTEVRIFEIRDETVRANRQERCGRAVGQPADAEPGARRGDIDHAVGREIRRRRAELVDEAGHDQWCVGLDEPESQRRSRNLVVGRVGILVGRHARAGEVEQGDFTPVDAAELHRQQTGGDAVCSPGQVGDLQARAPLGCVHRQARDRRVGRDRA